jgi:hypothetical protein
MERHGVFLSTKRHGLNLTPRSVMVYRICGDGRKFNDKISHQKEICNRIGIENIHVLATNGGALWMAPHQKFYDAFPRYLKQDFPKSEMDIEETLESCDLMDTDIVGLEGHGPCAKARQAGMNQFEVAGQIVSACEILVSRRPDLQVIPYYHRENGVQNTYIIDPAAYRACEAEIAQFASELSASAGR